MSSGNLQETVTVLGETPITDSPSRADDRKQPPSSEVLDLQRRAAGVLPIRIDIPRAGLSYRFVKPLVIDQDTSVTFRYKRR